jgi:hypothetical protein
MGLFLLWRLFGLSFDWRSGRLLGRGLYVVLCCRILNWDIFFDGRRWSVV